MKKINPLLAVIIVSFWISIYQINLVEQKLSYYRINNTLSSYLPLGLQIQQAVEFSKISLKGLFINQDEYAEIAQTPSFTPVENITPIAENHEIIVDHKKDKCKEKCVILTIGDSVMGDLYYSLNRQLKKLHPDWKIINAHKVSSGLSNSIYYNWPQVAEKLVKEINPDYVIILIGMNDAQGLVDSGKGFNFNSSGWKDIYKERVARIFQSINQKNTAIWVELPHVQAESFNKRLQVVRDIHQAVAQDKYVTVKELIGDNQQEIFSKFRQIDGVHLNALGADTVANHIYGQILN